MDFKQYLNEAAKKAKEKEEESTAVMSFGRFNPPTIGHEKLIRKTEEVAQQHSGTAHIVASHSEGTAKNPVPQQAKIGYLHNIVKPSTELSGSSKEEPTILHAAARLHKQGHKHLVVVAGSDRVNDYQELLNQYNDGKKYPHGSYKFKSIKVLSAGQRDPDAEGAAGMSGTKIREYARAGNTAKFRAALPDALKSHAGEIMGHIKAAPLKEEIDPIREAYVNNQIYKIDDMVEAKNGDKGPIVFRGSTYVTIQLAEGKTVKHWIKDIKESTRSKPEIIIKHRRLMEKQIPALFMSKQKLEELAKGGMEIEYQGYQTENLHMCPGASENLKDLIHKEGMNPKYVLQAIQASDKYLGAEEQAKKQGFADEQLVHDFNMYLAIAHDTLNMLGYPDASLTYMSKHIKDMAALSMHKDGTFANETISTIPTFGGGDASESYTPIVKETITMDKLRKRIAEVKNSVALSNQQDPEDPPTAHRDVNLNPDKEVYHGVDHGIGLKGFDGKELGLVSFKSFFATPETQKIEKEKGEAMQDVHRAKAKLSSHSSAYKMMAKSSQMGH